MGQNFRIRFRSEHMSMFAQPLAKLHIVFDDAVMHHRDFTLAIRMGMRVGIRRAAMGGPTGMPDAHRCLAKDPADLAFQIGDLALAANKVQAAILQHRNSRGIITPVFQGF